jgi:hypothetical protein
MIYLVEKTCSKNGYPGPSSHLDRSINIHPQPVIATAVEKPDSQRKPSRKFAMRVLKSASFCRAASTFLIE